MIYTTHGLMTPADLADHFASDGSVSLFDPYDDYEPLPTSYGTL